MMFSVLDLRSIPLQKVMQFIKLNVLILFLLLSSVSSEQKEEWREISVLSKTAIWSASRAAGHLGVKYISMLKAYEKIDTDIHTYSYWVFFMAESIEGEPQECQGKVWWSTEGGVEVTSASCDPVAY
ncbi:uncharacterized protein LOC128546171 [Mercenaria mercenaria]|uniref:uncharacterized protein LOC128546171 n=1 Tax=Mercenaria mercenaria TaxID=6596 RepID=UPI00234EF83E|nr:uncharacterized protein LOC128546171 [Mercenaria mercenaria]